MLLERWRVLLPQVLMEPVIFTLSQQENNSDILKGQILISSLWVYLFRTNCYSSTAAEGLLPAQVGFVRSVQAGSSWPGFPSSSSPGCRAALLPCSHTSHLAPLRALAKQAEKPHHRACFSPVRLVSGACGGGG